MVTAAHCHLPGRLEVSSVVLGEFDVATDPDCDGCRFVNSRAVFNGDGDC